MSHSDCLLDLLYAVKVFLRLKKTQPLSGGAWIAHERKRARALQLILSVVHFRLKRKGTELSLAR